MTWRQTRLLRRIQRYALDENAPISRALHQCLLLGARYGSTELTQWADRELVGYEGVPQSDFPRYRKIPAQLKATTQVAVPGGVVTNADQIVNRYILPEDMRSFLDEPAYIGHSVTQLESVLQGADPSSTWHAPPPGAHELGAIIAHQMQERMRVDVYYDIPVSSLAGVLQQVRTRMIQLAATLERTAESTRPVTPERITQAMRDINIDGNDNSVTVTIGAESGSAPSPSIARWGTVWTAVAAVAAVASAIIAFFALK